jgi:hypothetical protein
MIRSRKFKQQLDQPPNRPLRKDEVAHIARAGGIDFANRAEEFSDFEEALECIRCRYKPIADWKRLSLNDNQIRKRLDKMRLLASQLHALLSDPAFDRQTRILIVGEGERWDRKTSNKLKALSGIIRQAELGLEKLEERSANSPNDWAIPPAGKPGLKDLLIELMHLWQVATNTLEPQAENNSPLIPFLREGARVIAQQNVDHNTALGWVRDLLPRAYKHLKLGYLPLRDLDDPELLNLLQSGSDLLKRLF